MDKQEILEKLRDDENYYGEFGKTYLSNSDIMALLNNPLDFKKQSPPTTAMVIGDIFTHASSSLISLISTKLSKHLHGTLKLIKK